MKEDMDKLDQLFEKAFSGFEESPPVAVKTSVFRRMLYFNAWRSLRKYVVIFAILLMIGGVAWFSGAFSSGPSQQIASQNSTVVKQESDQVIPKTKSNVEVISSDSPDNIASSTSKTVGSAKTSNPKSLVSIENNADEKPILNKKTANTSKTSDEQVSNNNSIHLDKHKTNTSDNNSKPAKNDINSTPQLATANVKANALSGQKKTEENRIEMSDKTTEMPAGTIMVQTEVQPNSNPDSLNNLINQDVGNVLLNSNNNSNPGVNKKSSLLWSVGLDLGHSILQSGFIKTKEEVSDEVSAFHTSLNFPSGFVGLNIRAEKQHFFFDFGLQYASFSEKISTDQLLYNPTEFQNLEFLGQNTIIDTSGYWHYFYLSTTSITIIDSIWTLRNDTTIINLYDTAYLQRYDTLKNPSWVNTYSQFEFPVNVGWMKSFGKVNLGISTGPIFSLLVGTKGKLPYHYTNGTELIATRQEFKAFKLGISWQITGLVNYQLTDRMTIEFMPYYRRTLLPFKSAVSSAVLRNNSLGLQIGFRYYF
jgi:hypothetical protein